MSIHDRPARNGPSRRRALGAALALAAFPAAAADVSLRRLAADKGLWFGAAVEPQHLRQDAAYAELVRRQCAVLTPENALKWDHLRPAPDKFDFQGADAIVRQARAQGARVHGHCLVWHEALPRWMPPTLTASEAEALLAGHISQVAGRYAGRIASWDVVNEPIERAHGRPDGLRRSPWFEALGPDFIELSLRLARRADPRARLAIADYGLEYDDVPWMVEKRASTLALLAHLKRRGAPLDAFAIQGHLLGDRGPAFGAGLRGFLRDLARLGLEVWVTELDVLDTPMPADPVTRDAQVAEIYGAFLRTVLAEPAVRMVNTWGLSDRYTSKSFLHPRPDRQPVRPLPFDAELQPKPAAQALAAAFRSARRR